MEKKIILEGDNFIATQFIGEGSFGKVYLGETKDTNQICAIKKIKLKNKEELERKMTLRELEIMKTVKHENCVDLFFIEPEDYQNADLVYIVMEYCGMGNLNEYIDSKTQGNERIPIEEVKEIFGQILKGLKYLYQKNIVHRDLKPENILLQKNIDSKFGYTIKLTDFGFAREIPKDDLGKTQIMNTFIGTLSYVAPEILFNNSYTSNVDLWSLGSILYEIITGNPAFQAFGRNSLETKYQNTIKKSLPKEYLKIVPKECNDLVERLLTVDPHSRIKREELYKHPFIFEKLNELIGDSNQELTNENSNQELNNENSNQELNNENSNQELINENSNQELINENSKKKIFGIAKIDSQNDDDNFLSFSKGDEVEIIEIDGKIGIGKLNGKEGEIFINDFDIKEN
ncbi:serine/threonine-protein kinase ulk3 [Anaeramoeba ignava]|uniref:Serine/threonine-protein kinase ulk3 n=1 Tax=Anaeramoeba ignava TaxID=1746090 RepID=A0A9Q0LU98_ANAIG|nr:serine/threonine-protein kinase ulk3 [Anaeramoeba ignava]